MVEQVTLHTYGGQICRIVRTSGIAKNYYGRDFFKVLFLPIGKKSEKK